MNGGGADIDWSKPNSAVEGLSSMHTFLSRTETTDQSALKSNSPGPIAISPASSSFFRRAQLEMAALQRDQQNNQRSGVENTSNKELPIEDLVEPSILQSESTSTKQEQSKNTDETFRAFGGVQQHTEGTKILPHSEIGESSHSMIGSRRASSTPLTTPPTTPIVSLNRLEGLPPKTLNILAQAEEVEAMSANSSAASPNRNLDNATSSPINTAQHRIDLENNVDMVQQDSSRRTGGGIDAFAERSTSTGGKEDPQMGMSLSQHSPPATLAEVIYSAMPSGSQTHNNSPWPVYCPFVSTEGINQPEISSSASSHSSHQRHCPSCVGPDLCGNTTSATSPSPSLPWPIPPSQPSLPCGCPLPIMVPVFHQHRKHHPNPASAPASNVVHRQSATISVYHNSPHGADNAQTSLHRGVSKLTAMNLAYGSPQLQLVSHVDYRAEHSPFFHRSTKAAPSFSSLASRKGMKGGVPMNRHKSLSGTAQRHESKEELLHTESDGSRETNTDSDRDIMSPNEESTNREVAPGIQSRIQRNLNMAPVAAEEAEELVSGKRCSSCPPISQAGSKYAQAFLFGRPILNENDFEQIRLAMDVTGSASLQDQSRRWRRADRPHDVKRVAPRTRVAPSNLDLLTTAEEREAAVRRQGPPTTKRRAPMKLSERIREIPTRKGQKLPKSAPQVEVAESELKDIQAITKDQGRKRKSTNSGHEGEEEAKPVSVKRAKRGLPSNEAECGLASSKRSLSRIGTSSSGTRAKAVKGKSSNSSTKVTSGSARKKRTFWAYVSEESSPEPLNYPMILESRLRNGRSIAPTMEKDSPVDIVIQPKLAIGPSSTRPRSESTVTSGDVRPIAGSSRAFRTPVPRQGTSKPAVAPRASFTDKAGKFMVTMPKGSPKAGQSPEPDLTFVQPPQMYMNPPVLTREAVRPHYSSAVSAFPQSPGLGSSPAKEGTYVTLPTTGVVKEGESSAGGRRIFSEAEDSPAPSIPPDENVQTANTSHTMNTRGRIKREGSVYLADMETIMKNGPKQLRRGGWEYIPEDEYEPTMKTNEAAVLTQRIRRGRAAT